MEASVRFAAPVAFLPLPADKLLVQHPPSGAWVMIGREDRARVETLAKAANSGLLDGIANLDDPILAPFLKAGLLRPVGPGTQGRAPEPGPVRMLILKMVGYCNLACTYCYDFNDVHYKDRLTIEDATAAIEQGLELADDGLQVLFHGGEPLLAFRAVQQLTAFAKERALELGRQVSFSIQTNGTRFTDEIVKFLLDEEFSVGLSIDGPPELNDKYRIDHRGRGSGAGIEAALMKWPELRRVTGVLTTVTSNNVRHLGAIVEYVRSLGIRSWDATLFQEAGRATQTASSTAPGTREVVDAWLDLLDGVEAGTYDRIRISPVLHYIHNVLSYARNNICMRGGGCGAGRELISISAGGAIEACDCIKKPELELGRVATTSLREARTGKTAGMIRARTQDTLSPCRTCGVRAYCGGTCLAKAGDLEVVDDTECALALAVFPAIFERMAVTDRIERYASLHP